MKQRLAALEYVYGQQAGAIMARLLELLKNTPRMPPADSEGYWYKFVELYCVYADGLSYGADLNPLQSLKQHLAKVKQLGCNAVHILPFLASPLIDKGYDISDYYAIRSDLGSMADLYELIAEASRLNLKLFMDLVLNHISDQHDWFIKAQSGNAYYRDFFIHTHEMPKFIRKFQRDGSIWAEYEVDGKTMTANIIFPEHTGPIPHWRQGDDGIWYYHTFYPQQLDLNWFNPELFIEIAKIVIFWATLGFSFRLDAIHFIGKGPYKMFVEENRNAYALIAVLKWVVDQINPNSAIIVEASEDAERLIPYFGSLEVKQANLAYNFHICNELWLSLVDGNTENIWQEIGRFKGVPEHAEWLNFLRNHDELSLAYLSEAQIQQVRSAIAKYGMDFREGYGLSGRTYSLLAENDAKFLLAYFLLASLPGGNVIPYGDEIAKKNIPLAELPPQEQADTRNINRGLIDHTEYHSPRAAEIFQTLSQIIHKRKELRNYLNIWPEKLAAADGVFAAKYQKNHSSLLIYANLTEQPQEITLQDESMGIILQLNKVTLHGQKVVLGPYSGVWLSL